MELRGARELRRGGQPGRAAEKKAEPPARAQARPAGQQGADKCTLSRQALAWFEEQNQLRQAEDRRRAAESQDGDGALDLLKEGLDVLEKCLKIAASVRKGDKVPPEDLEYLLNNDPAGYAMAMAQRREKKDPEEVESVLDEEDRNGGGAESGGGEAPAVSAPEAAGGE